MRVPRQVRIVRATSVRPRRHHRVGQGPTEPRAGRSAFLLSSGGAEILPSGLLMRGRTLPSTRCPARSWWDVWYESPFL